MLVFMHVYNVGSEEKIIWFYNKIKLICFELKKDKN